jgi:hypothetical protein
MKEERIKILNMLQEGKISVEEAEQLLSTLSEPDDEEISEKERKKRKYLKILVYEPPNLEKPKVNVRVPFKLIKWGLRFAPKDGNINIGDKKFSQEEFDEMISDLTEGDIVEINAEDDNKIVKIYVE